MGVKNISGREEEQRILRQVLSAKQAEFIALYGRRRVGKTFLIREFFAKKGLYLEATGIKDGPADIQLENFIKAFSELFHEGVSLKTPSNWREAFEILTERIRRLPKTKKFILFLDELPWMATLKSGLVQAIDYYWNKYWSALPNFILITCGSAASWMLDHLIFATGGLYNRVTKRLLLEPFTLTETAHFLEKRGLRFKPKLILDLYMVMGGVPFYLNEVEKGTSVDQTIDKICFNKKGLLYSEFTNLFRSLFDHGQEHQMIVRALAQGGSLSRDQIIRATNIPSGGAINRRLDELEASGFIQKFVPYGKKRRDALFRIIDQYTLFYLKWIEPLIDRGASTGNYWKKLSNTPQRTVWAGFAFESICIKHLDHIAHALGLDHTTYLAGSWRYISSSKSSLKDGAQIDLLFDRNDDVVTLCEVKYSDKIYTIDKAYAKVLDRKLEIFADKGPLSTRKKQHQLALVTSLGLKKNMYSEDLIDHSITLKDLF